MKKTINKKAFVSKPVAAAVGLAMGALVAANAQAVSISNDGIGEVLMFPYYTVNNGYNTNINITNTTADTVAFKIRFRESENSRDARDFNVIMSPYDVWNATITMNEDGYARVQTNDTTCTVGELPAVAGSTAKGINFTNLDFINQVVDNRDYGSEELTRTNEGHIEVISMGRVPAGGENVSGTIAYNALHVDGVPRDCDAVRQGFTQANITATRDEFVAPINALKGSVSFINVNSGKAITSEPTVLANFYDPADSSDNLVVLPETQAPGLHDVEPATAYWVEGDGTGVAFTATSAPVDAVSALIMREGVVNQYSVNPAVNGQTDWVVTFPTKHYYVDERNPLANVVDSVAYYPTHTHLVGEDAAVAPFTQTFQNGNDACAKVGVEFNFFNREEAQYTPPSTVGFSPAEPGKANSICKEVQVITFNQTNLFGAADAANVDTSAAGFNSGWMSLDFTGSRNLPGSVDYNNAGSPEDVELTGFPVIGFSATTLENGVAGDFMLNYGFSANHGYTRGEIVTP